MENTYRSKEEAHFIIWMKLQASLLLVKIVVFFLLFLFRCPCYHILLGFSVTLLKLLHTFWKRKHNSNEEFQYYFSGVFLTVSFLKCIYINWNAKKYIFSKFWISTKSETSAGFFPWQCWNNSKSLGKVNSLYFEPSVVWTSCKWEMYLKM